MCIQYHQPVSPSYPGHESQGCAKLQGRRQITSSSFIYGYRYQIEKKRIERRVCVCGDLRCWRWGWGVTKPLSFIGVCPRLHFLGLHVFMVAPGTPLYAFHSGCLTNNSSVAMFDLGNTHSVLSRKHYTLSTR